MLELAGDDRRAGAGIVIGNPVAWATMGKGLVRRERGELDEAEGLFDEALRIADEEGDPEIASWTRSNQAMMLAMRGDPEAAVALARRNCELTERLGDVFSRSLALSNLGATQLAAGEAEAASNRWKRPSGSTATRSAAATRWRAGARACARKR